SADSATQGSAYRQAFQRQRRISLQRPIFHGAICGLAIHRLAGTIDHTTENTRADTQGRLRASRDYAVAVADATGPFERHRQDGPPAKPDDLPGKCLAVFRQNRAALSHGTEGAVRLHKMANGFGDTPGPTQCRKFFKPPKVSF